MGRGRKRVLTFFISYMICLMFLLYHMHGIDESDPAFVLDIQPHYSRSESANKLRRWVSISVLYMQIICFA